jgi:S-adenosylmethionine/arginine decarboxylase-like enzyme
VLQHKHLIFRIETKTPPKDVDVITDWLADLVKRLGMELFAGPFVKYLDEPGNRGATGVCIIKTSHISLCTCGTNLIPASCNWTYTRAGAWN